MPDQSAIPWPSECPTKAGAYWTDAPAWWCWMVKRITGSRWPHIGVFFEWPDGRRLRAEALTDGLKRERGIVGPQSWDSLVAFVAKPGCAACYTVLTAGQPSVAQMYSEAQFLQRFASYSEWQLLRMWAHERLGIPVRGDMTRLVCSEYASRVAIAGGMDFRDRKRKRHDEVTPGSAMRQAVSIHGAIVRDIVSPAKALRAWEVAP